MVAVNETCWELWGACEVASYWNCLLELEVPLQGVSVYSCYCKIRLVRIISGKLLVSSYAATSQMALFQESRL